MGKRVTSELSGLPPPPTLILSLLHPTSWPPCVPLPQDGAEHTGTNIPLEELLPSSEHPGAYQQDPEGHGEGPGPAQLEGSPQNA